MNYVDAIKLLTSQGKFRIGLGLDRVVEALKRFENPQEYLKCIQVAGTNGKGSVCEIISTILEEYGMKTGLYTSPHIFEYTERIKISKVPISKEDFAFYLDIVNEKTKDIQLTEFEILTVIMFKYFADKKVDVVVLETGLGGRFDATNVIKSNLCAVITHIDYDHTERLGNTLSQIAYEKAGIIKPNSSVITSEGYEVIKNVADENNSLFMLIAPFENTSNLSLKGLQQQQNLSLALATVRHLFPEITEKQIQEALLKVRNPFRFEYFENKNMIIDVAHNPNSIMALKNNLDFYYPNINKRFVFGCLKNKDYNSMINELFDAEDEIYFYHFDNPNSVPVKELQKACRYHSSEFCEKFDYRDGKLTVVCGSFYMLKELLPKL